MDLRAGLAALHRIVVSPEEPERRLPIFVLVHRRLQIKGGMEGGGREGESQMPTVSSTVLVCITDCIYFGTTG